MSWGTTLKVYISRLHPEGAEGELQNAKDVIQIMRDELMQLAAATPRDMKDDLGYDYRWEEYSRHKVSEIMEGLEDYYIRKYQCELIRDASPEEISKD